MRTTSGITRRALAVALCTALGAAGCAPAAQRGITVAPGTDRQAARDVLADYVQSLPVGSRVRVADTAGRTLRGTLMKATDRSILIQPRTRIPEPPMELALAGVVSVTPESSNGPNMGKVIGLAAAAGAGAALGVLMILAAIYSD